MTCGIIIIFIVDEIIKEACMNQNQEKPIVSGETNIKIVSAILLAILLGAIHLAVPGFYSQIWYLATAGNMEEIIEVLRSYGPWAMLISMIIDILINAVGFLPSIFLSTANGVVFGLLPGIIISWLAETIGVVISFYIMRFLLHDTATKLISKSKFLVKVDDISDKNGLVIMTFARALPYFPSGIITALGAISKIKPRDYIIANLIGKFPSTALEVTVGRDVVMLQTHMERLGIIIIGAAIAYYILWKLYKRYMKSRK